ncbi:MAG: murein biosynthesis integral membrane protein MurJ [Mycobacteriaceae bacterium]
MSPATPPGDEHDEQNPDRDPAEEESAEPQHAVGADTPPEHDAANLFGGSWVDTATLPAVGGEDGLPARPPLRSHGPARRSHAQDRATEADRSTHDDPVAADPTTGERSDRGLLRTTGSLALPTLISRITGFAKVLVLGYVLGLEAVSSAFNLANTLPNIIAELVLGAVLTSIVIPVLVRAEREDPDGGTAFTRRLFTVAGTVLVVATVASVLGARAITSLYLDSDAKLSSTLVTHLAVLLLPQILFYGFSALTGAVLNTKGVYGLVAWAPVLNNVVSLGVLVAYVLTPGELTASFSNPLLLVLGVGTTLGIVAQAVVVLPALRRAGVDLRPLWGLDPRLKQFAGMAVAVIGYVLVSQLALTVTYNVASSSSDSGVTLYNYAWLLLQLPYGVLGVSLLTAIMPRMSRAAAAGDDATVVADLSLGSRLSVLALTPIVVLFTAHGGTLGVALFSYGAAGAGNADLLGQTVAASAFGLLPYAVVLLQLRVFYARQQAWVPTVVMLVMVTVRIPLMLLAPLVLPAEKVVLGLAALNAVGFVVGAALGAHLLRRELGALELRSLVRTTAWVLGASLLGLAVDLVVGAVVPLGRLVVVFGGLGAVVDLAVRSVLVLVVVVVVLLRSPLSELDAVRPLATRVLARIGASTLVAPVRRTGNGAALPYPQHVTGGTQGHRGLTPRSRPGGVPVSADSDRLDVVGTRDAGAPDAAAPDAAAPSRGPTAARPASAPAPWSVRGPRLVPGAAVAGGRYRLLAEHGGTRSLRFWQARDTTLDRDVALTFVDAEQRQPPGHPGSGADRGPQAVLTRTRRLGGLDTPGLARVLDVVRGSSGGIVVAEWTAGRSLREVAETTPSPVGAARAVSALAAAAEAAHRAGTVLALDHPDRVRISSTGSAVLAFPAVSDGAEPAADIRGLGAVLYALTTARWPLPGSGDAGAEDTGAGDTGAGDAETDSSSAGDPDRPTDAADAPEDAPGDSATVGGLPLAPRTKSGAAVEPRTLRAAIPFEISAVTMRALEPDSGLRTAAAVETVLRQAAVLDQRTEMLPALTLGDTTSSPAGATTALGNGFGATGRGPDGGNGPRLTRSRKLTLGVVGLVVVIVVVGAILLSQLTSVFGGSSGDTRLPALKLGKDGSVLSSTAAPANPATPAPAPVPAPVVAPVVAGASVYSPGGTADNPNTVGLAVDGNPATVWPTDQYRQPMGRLKNGVGVMVNLKAPTTLSAVTIVSPSPGTVVEVRTSPTDNPPLDQTAVVATATLNQPSTIIPVKVTAPVQHVLIWITTLSTASGTNQSDIGEISLAP